jgi:hypothetical protein
MHINRFREPPSIHIYLIKSKRLPVIAGRKALFAVFAALASLGAGLQAGMAYASGEQEPPSISLGTRGTLEISDDGSFGLASGREIIGLSSHWTVRLGDIILAPGTPQFMRSLAAPLKEGGSAFRMMLGSQGVFIELAYEASGGTAILTATMVNMGNSSVTVALRCALEIHASQIGLDGSGIINRETAFAPGCYSQILGYFGGRTGLSCLLPGTPELVELVSAPQQAVGSLWDFPINPNLELGDVTGALVFWPQKALRPGGFCRERLLLTAGPAEGVAFPQNELSLDSLSVTPASDYENRTRTLNVSVRNSGPSTDLELTVLFMLEGVPFSMKFIPIHVGWNRTDTVKLSWTPYTRGNYTISAMLPFYNDADPVDNVKTRPAVVMLNPYMFIMRFPDDQAIFTNTSYAGAKIQVRIFLYNTGPAFDSVRLTVEQLPDRWTAMLSSNLVRLDVNQKAYTDLTVRPSSSTDRGLYIFNVVGSSVGNGETQHLQMIIEIGLPPATKTDPRAPPLTPGISGPQNDTPAVAVRPYKLTKGDSGLFSSGSTSNAVLATVGITAALGIIAVAIYQAAGLRTLTVMQRIIKRALYNLSTGDEYRKTIFDAYRKMCAHLEDYGYTRYDHVTPREFARAMKLALPLDTEAIRALTRIFEEARYSNHSMGALSRQAAIDNLRFIERELDKLTLFVEHPSAWQRIRTRMGMGNN